VLAERLDLYHPLAVKTASTGGEAALRRRRVEGSPLQLAHVARQPMDRVTFRHRSRPSGDARSRDRR
jgi:hypothetical protein